jgi:protein-S-isoprenylcysteine O-methyltransferase Ste14
VILHGARNGLPPGWGTFIDRLPFNSGPRPNGVSVPLLVGTLVAVAGVALRRWAMATLGRHFTLELTLRPTHKLITAPPYDIVRHPSYTGGLLVTLGAALAFCVPVDGWFRAHWLAKLSSPQLPFVERALGLGITGLLGGIFGLGVVQAFSRTQSEDRMLHERFGKDWDKWSTRTPYKLFPLIY